MLNEVWGGMLRIFLSSLSIAVPPARYDCHTYSGIDPRLEPIVHLHRSEHHLRAPPQVQRREPERCLQSMEKIK